jgi:hypothetical protein
MPQSVGWQFIGHMVRTVFEVDSLNAGSRVQVGTPSDPLADDGTRAARA